MKALNYTGPSLDYSGYGEANRHDIGALLAAGVDVSTTIPSYCEETAEYGELGQIVSDLEGKQNGYEVKVIHTTPDVIPHYLEEGKYHIGRILWETDKLPELFAAGARLCDEIWTPSEYNASAIRAAGVDVPIYVIPEAVDANIVRPEPFKIDQALGYRFYSIFEWTERKNPRKLLEAYWREFENDDPDTVSFLLKTYISNFNWKKKEEIIGNIEILKHKLGLSNYAPIYMYGDLMNRNQIYRFHMAGDCLVSAHRGEGWGIPQMEALLMGKPVISTNLGGIHEYLTDKDALLLGYKMVPVTTDRNPQWYCDDQNWAEIDVDELRAKMRWCFNNREAAKAMGEVGSKSVIRQFSFPAVGELMKARLEQI